MYRKAKEEEDKITFQQFCKETSLAGWKFIYFKNCQPRHAAFWVLVILSMITASGIIIRDFALEFSESTVVYNIKSPTVNLDHVFFPSVVVCNMNVMRRSFITSLLNDTKISQKVNFGQLHGLIEDVFVSGGKTQLSDDEQEIIDLILDSEIYSKQYEEFVSINEEEGQKGYSNVPLYHFHSIQDAPKEEWYTPKYKRIYLPEIASQFRSDNVLLSLDFSSGFGINHDGGGFSTDISDTCHWLTPFVQEPEDPFDLWTNKAFARNGLSNGLELLLDAEVYDYALSKSGMEGFTLSVLYHLDIPIMKNIGLSVLPGQSSQMAVTVELMNTSLQVRKRFTPEERHCYFEGELNLKHMPPINSFRYDMSNCLFEATLQRIEKQCKCVPRYFADEAPEIEVCQGVGISCMNDLLDVMGDNRTVFDNGMEMVCLANCIDQKYDVKVTSATYPNKQAFIQSSEFCLVHDKLVKSCQNEKRFTLEEVYPNLCNLLADSNCTKGHGSCKNHTEIPKLITQYTRENIAKVYIYLREPFVKEIIREEKITLIQFIGSTGGLLGLFLGFSVVSLVEIFYMIFLWLANKVTQHSSSFNMDKDVVSQNSQNNYDAKNVKRRTNAKVSSYLESIVNSKDNMRVKPAATAVIPEF